MGLGDRASERRVIRHALAPPAIADDTHPEPLGRRAEVAQDGRVVRDSVRQQVEAAHPELLRQHRVSRELDVVGRHDPGEVAHPGRIQPIRLPRGHGTVRQLHPRRRAADHRNRA